MPITISNNQTRCLSLSLSVSVCLSVCLSLSDTHTRKKKKNTSENVFIHYGVVKVPCHSRPFPVQKRTDNFIIVLQNGKQDTVSIDRLMSTLDVWIRNNDLDLQHWKQKISSQLFPRTKLARFTKYGKKVTWPKYLKTNIHYWTLDWKSTPFSNGHQSRPGIFVEITGDIYFGTLKVEWKKSGLEDLKE